MAKKSWEKGNASGHGTTLFLPVKEAGGSTSQLPWHRLCVIGLMLYAPLQEWTAVFTSLCASDAFADADSYYKKMRCFFCLFSVFLVPPVSPAPWYLSPHWVLTFLVTKRQDLIGTILSFPIL